MNYATLSHSDLVGLCLQKDEQIVKLQLKLSDYTIAAVAEGNGE